MTAYKANTPKVSFSNQDFEYTFSNSIGWRITVNTSQANEDGRVVIEDKIPASLIFDQTSLIAYKTTGTYTSTLNSAFADAMLSPDAYELELGDDGSFKISFDVTEELQNAKYIAFYYRTGVADEYIRSKPPTSSA